MTNYFMAGFTDELEKNAAILEALGGKVAANAVGHWIMNTRFSPKQLKTLFENAGDDMMAAGFRHAIQGRKLRPTVSFAIGSLVSPSAVYMYNTGLKYGEKVRETMSKIPLASALYPFKALKAADVTAKVLSKSAPYTGAIAGTAYGYETGKSSRRPIPVKSMIAGAITGGLMGEATKSLAPHAPVIKQLDYVTKSVAEPVLKGAGSRLGRFLDKMTYSTSSKIAK